MFVLRDRGTSRAPVKTSQEDLAEAFAVVLEDAVLDVVDFAAAFVVVRRAAAVLRAVTPSDEAAAGASRC